MIIDSQTLDLAVDGESLVHVAGNGDQITMDRRWTPYIQGTFTVTAPADPDILDPRTRPLLEVTWLQRFGSELQFTSDLTAIWAGLLTSDLTLMYAGDLTSDISNTPGRSWNPEYHESTSLHAFVFIRQRVNNYDGTYTLTVEGVESQFRDYPYSANGNAGIIAASLRELYPKALENWNVFFGAPSLPLEPGSSDVAIPLGLLGTGWETIRAAPLKPQITLYDYMETYLTIGDLRLWGDEDGLLRLTANSEPVDVEVTLASDVTIVTAEDSIDLDDDLWGDMLEVEYDPNPSDSGQPVAYLYHPSLPGVKKLHIKFPGPSPFTGFTIDTLGPIIAAPLYERMIRRGRMVPVTALNDFRVRPGITVNLVDLPDTPDQTGLVSATTWDVDSGEMTVTIDNLEEA